MLVAGVACAAFFAAGQYVRATAVSLLIPVALLPWLVGWPLRRTLQRAALIGGLLVVFLLPVVAYNLRAHGDLSLSTSAYGGWSLYVGANREYGGQWNPEDAARLAEFPGGLVVGSEPIRWQPGAGSHPGGPGRLVWRSCRPSSSRCGTASRTPLRTPCAPERVTRDVHVGWLVTQLFWTLLAVLAAVGMWAGRRRRPRPAALLIGMTITLVAVTHLALEVHSRYHAYLVPLFCLLAAVGVQALHRRWRGRRSTLAAG